MQQLKQGTLLHGGAYRIEQVLGQGSFGITYLAVHTALDKKVAIKEFFMKEINGRGDDGSITGMSDGSLSMNYARKFQKEALNLSSLEHPNIVRVTDSFEDNGTFYYVMDYIEGENLNDYVKHNYISRQEAVDIIRDVAKALMYMHEEKHMLHLDLKPGNIMRRSSDGHIFLIDFGLSKHYSSNGQPETSTTIGLGTAGYAPIEQANQTKNGEFRPTIDVYALGATFYKLLTRETPPAASELVSDNELLANNLKQHNINSKLSSVVVNAMLPSVRMRTQSVKEFLASLDSKKKDATINTSTSSKRNATNTTSDDTIVPSDNDKEATINKVSTEDEILSVNSINDSEIQADNDNRSVFGNSSLKRIVVLTFIAIIVFLAIIISLIGWDDNTTTIPKDNTSLQTDTITPCYAVDLGLPSGTLWADRNLGASFDSDEGNLYVWGCSLDDINSVNVPDSVYNIAGTSYDIVQASLGNSWCLPTTDQFKELHDYCSIKKTQKLGREGYLVTGPNGKTLFFPFSSLYKKQFGNWDYQMSWTDYKTPEQKAYACNLVNGFYYWEPTLKVTIRPVKKQ